MNKIKKGCIARCAHGMLGLVTSTEKVMTRYGKLAWLGIQLSPDKAGNEWCSQNPEFVSESIEDLIDHNITIKNVYIDDLSDEIKRSLLNKGDFK